MNAPKPDYIKDKKAVTVDVGASSEMAKMAEQLLDLKGLEDTLDGQLKDTRKQIEELENQLYDKMDNVGIDLFRAHDNSFFTQLTDHPSVQSGKLEEFINWLDANGHGTIAKRSIHPSTLKGWVGDQKSQNLPVPAEFVSVYQKKHVRTRRNPKSTK